MNILFIGCRYSETQKDSFLKNSKKGYQFAAQNFQEALLDGFLENGVLPYVITKPPLSTFPMGYKHPIISDANFIYKGKILGKSIGYINIPFINSMTNKLFKSAKKWYNSTNGEKYVLVYGLHSHLMSVAIKLKQTFNNVKLGIIIPDLPQYMGCNKIYKTIGLQKRNINKIQSMIKNFDSYVVLTKPMIDKLNIANKPYIVIEGIYSKKNPYIHKKDFKQKIILYTGGLMFRYGIGYLVDAFIKIPGDEYNLILCGIGDAVTYIKECAKIDPRIKYEGMLPKNKIEELQSKATLLVNPRFASEDFTQYSFPSKTMEYLASGIPTVMFHLKSIPHEYDKYLFYFEEETTDCIAQTIQYICKIDSSIVKYMGEKATDFIINEKGSKFQVKKIIDLLKES